MFLNCVVNMFTSRPNVRTIQLDEESQDYVRTVHCQKGLSTRRRDIQYENIMADRQNKETANLRVFSHPEERGQFRSHVISHIQTAKDGRETSVNDLNGRTITQLAHVCRERRGQSCFHHQCTKHTCCQYQVFLVELLGRFGPAGAKSVEER
jgi:hypothetical protein